MQDNLKWLDGLLEGKDYIAGNRFTIADIILFAALDFGAGVGQKIDPSLKNVNAWFKRVEARPSAAEEPASCRRPTENEGLSDAREYRRDSLRRRPRWCARRPATPARASSRSSALPGHAGFGYSFILERTTRGGASGKLVLRVAPEGVQDRRPCRRGAPGAHHEVARGYRRAGAPRSCGMATRRNFSGVPTSSMASSTGSSSADVALPAEEARAYARTGIETLAALHRVPWEPRRDAWGSVTELSEEMKRLDHLLDRDTLDPKVVARAPELREKLRSSLPANPRVGIVHGDFQFSNILFKEHKTAAVIDWEISMIGPTLLDLGWICFFADRASFVDDGTVQHRDAADCRTRSWTSTRRAREFRFRWTRCDGSARLQDIASASSLVST